MKDGKQQVGRISKDGGGKTKNIENAVSDRKFKWSFWKLIYSH